MEPQVSPFSQANASSGSTSRSAASQQPSVADVASDLVAAATPFAAAAADPQTAGVGAGQSVLGEGCYADASMSDATKAALAVHSAMQRAAAQQAAAPAGPTSPMIAHSNYSRLAAELASPMSAFVTSNTATMPMFTTMCAGPVINTTLAVQASASLYIKNLPPDADKLFLYERFAPYGAIMSVKVLIDPAVGKCRGVGFVNYAEQQSALRAIQALHGTKVGEKLLHVSLQMPRARPQAISPASSGLGTMQLGLTSQGVSAGAPMTPLTPALRVVHLGGTSYVSLPSGMQAMQAYQESIGQNPVGP